MPITSDRIDAEREGAREAAQGIDDLRDEVTMLAEQMGALGSSVGADVWSGSSADAFRGHVGELAQNASGLAQGYDDVAVALRGHAQALDALHAEVKDAEERLKEGKRDLKQAQADLKTAESAVSRAQSGLASAQQQERSAAADPTGGSQASAAGAVSSAQSALTTAQGDVTEAKKAIDKAEKAIRKAEDDLDDAEREHKRIGDRCGDEVMDARAVPFHTAAWEFVVAAISNMGRNDWTDFFSGAAMMPAVAAQQIMDKAADISSGVKALKAARKEGTPAQRQAARKAYKAALREIKDLRKDVKNLPWQPPGWLRRLNTPLGDVSRTLNKVPGVRSLPGISVALAGVSTAEDAKELGVAHAAAKNAASLGAGTAVAAGVTTGLIAVGAVGLAPVVAGVVVGGVVAAGVGYAVEEWGDDAAEAAGNVIEGAGEKLGEAKDKLTGLFS